MPDQVSRLMTCMPATQAHMTCCLWLMAAPQIQLSQGPGRLSQAQGRPLAYLACRQHMLAGGTSREPAVWWWCGLRNAQW